MNQHEQAPSCVPSSTVQDDEQALGRFGSLVIRNKEGRRVNPFGPEAGVSLRELRELREGNGGGSDV